MTKRSQTFLPFKIKKSSRQSTPRSSKMSTKKKVEISKDYDALIHARKSVGRPSRDEMIKRRSALIDPIQHEAEEQEFPPEFKKVEERPEGIKEKKERPIIKFSNPRDRAKS